MRRLARIAIALSAVLLLAQAPPATDKDLDKIRGEIRRLKERLEDVHRQTRDAKQELEAADLELGIHSRELEIATETRQRVDADRAQTEGEIKQLQFLVVKQKEHLGKRLSALYRLGGLSYLRILMSLDQRNDPSAAISMLTFLVTHDSRTIERFQDTERQLDVRKADLTKQQQELTELARVIEQRRKEVAIAYKEKQRVLASLQQQESGSAAQLADLEEKAKRLERLVGLLSKQEPMAGAPSSDIRTYHGTLAWPVEGELTEHFGRQRNAKFATYTNNNGIKINAPARAEVRAVFQGTVLFSQWFKGYGNLIILDHGNRIFSLYGNVVAPVVNVGDRITTGQAIAGVGEGEEPGSGYLYFEIRQDNRPDDPQKWLR
jgi:septal ring factor EnvC (AmiA/AmiB activator)